MVALTRPSVQTTENEEPQISDLKWAAVGIQEIVEKGHRLDASFYDIEVRQVRRDLKQCEWDIVYLGDKFIEDAFYLGRFKRIYVEEKNGLPLILPSQMTDIYPKASKFISPITNVDIESTRVKKAQVLLTRSGTVGLVSYVSKTLENQSLSDDVIRIKATDYSGYIYTYLKSKVGRLLVTTNNYGAVVKHIEPEHLDDIPIPNPPSALKQEIHNLIEESFSLRDDSNKLMDEAQVSLKAALQLPDIENLQERAEQFNKTVEVLNYSVPLGKLMDRLDGSYHVPIVQTIEQEIAKTAKKIVNVGDVQISQSVILPNRFRRIYVEEGKGVVFFGVTQINELDPSNKKYLSISQHSERIRNDLKIHTNSILITRSGTVGRVVIVPEHWEGWIPNEHIIRIVPANNEIAGYLCAWLSSNYAYPLINRYTYGAVVDEINEKQVAAISIPLLNDENTQKAINDKVLEANRKRTEAYKLEQEALTILDEKVIYAR